MQTGPIVRKRKNEKQYIQHRAGKTNECDFCEFDISMDQVRKEYKHFWIVKNLFSYDMWDQLDVVEHLMIVPKRHVDSIAHFLDAESKEYFKTLAEYEQEGYSMYARAPQNISKSVTHQHTHLIKLGNKKKKAVFYIKKPHIVLYV